MKGGKQCHCCDNTHTVCGGCWSRHHSHVCTRPLNFAWKTNKSLSGIHCQLMTHDTSSTVTVQFTFYQNTTQQCGREVQRGYGRVWNVFLLRWKQSCCLSYIGLLMLHVGLFYDVSQGLDDKPWHTGLNIVVYVVNVVFQNNLYCSIDVKWCSFYVFSK